MCQHWAENTSNLRKLFADGLELQNLHDFDIIETCIRCGRSKEFIQIVVEAGAIVKAKNLKHFYDEYDKLQQEKVAKHLFVSPSVFNHINEKIEILENAKNLENKAILLISKRKRLDKIKGIFILSLFILVIILIVFYSIT